MHVLRRGLLLRELWLGFLFKLRGGNVFNRRWRVRDVGMLELCIGHVCNHGVDLMLGVSGRLLLGDRKCGSMCGLRCWDLWRERRLKCGLCVALCSWEVFELGSECVLELWRGLFPSGDWSIVVFRFGCLRHRVLLGYYGRNEFHLKLLELRRRSILRGWCEDLHGVRAGLFPGIWELKCLPALRRWDLDNQRADRLRRLRCGILRGGDWGALLVLC